MFCTNCGAQIPDGSVFCTNCGAKTHMPGQMPMMGQNPVMPMEEESKTIAISPDVLAEMTQPGSMQNAVSQDHSAENTVSENAAAPETVQTTVGGAAPETVQTTVEGADAGAVAAEERAEAPEAVTEERAEAPEAVTEEKAEAPEAVAEEKAEAPEAVVEEKAEAPEAVTEERAEAAEAAPEEKAEAPEAEKENKEAAENGTIEITAAENAFQTDGPVTGTPYGAMQGNPQMGGMPYGAVQGDPQMGGMPYGAVQGNSQMGGMPYGAVQGDPQTGGMPYGAVQGDPQTGGMPYGAPQMGMPYVQPPKKKFVMPAVVNVIFGLLAIAAVAAFVCIMLFGRPESKEYQPAEASVTNWTENPKESQTEERSYDLSGETFELEIPETEQSIAAGELANGYIIADSDSRYLEYDELYAYTEDELVYAYFEILARSGVYMSDFADELDSYFRMKTWYNPYIYLYKVDDPSEILNEYELANLDMIGSFLDTEYYNDARDEFMDME